MDAANFEDFPDFGDLMTIEDWWTGPFIPSDGNGFFATAHQMSEDYDAFGPIPEWATHVMWFNN